LTRVKRPLLGTSESGLLPGMPATAPQRRDEAPARPSMVGGAVFRSVEPCRIRGEQRIGS